MFFFDFLHFFFEPELFAFSLDLQQANYRVFAEFEEDFRVTDFSFFEFGNIFSKPQFFEHAFDIFLWHFLFLFPLWLLVVLLLLVLVQAILEENVLCYLVLNLLLNDVQVLVLIKDVSQLVTCNLLLTHYVEYFFDFVGVIEEVGDDGSGLGARLEGEEHFGFFLALHHFHDSLPVGHGFDAVRGEVALSDVLQVLHSLDPALLPELVGVLLHVQSPQPLVYTQVLHLLVHVQQTARVLQSSFWVFFIL